MFVITVLGEPTTTSLDIDMLRHEGVTIASDTLACGIDKGPDYSDVTIDVELSMEEYRLGKRGRHAMVQS